MPKQLLSPQEYLEIERKAEFKSEYFNGEMFAMAGASLAHNRLVKNLISRLDAQLRSGACEVLPSDMRVSVSATGLYTYPDVVVVCGKPVLQDAVQDTLLNPTVIFEVLSPSTESYDRGKKFEQYSQIESLHGYVLVASDRVSVEHRYREGLHPWMLDVWTDAGQRFDLPSINATLHLGEIYEGVELT